MRAVKYFLIRLYFLMVTLGISMLNLAWNYLMQEVWQNQATRAEVVVLLHLIKLNSSEGQEDLPSAHLDLFSLSFEHGQA
jgi:hypothetical protein